MKRSILIMIVLPILILAGEWTLTGSLNQARKLAQAGLLPGGHSVLIAGGWIGGVGPTSSCEIWDSETGLCTYTDPLPIPLFNFVMVRLELDTGIEYLTIGGLTDSGCTNRCFRYNPETETWRETGSMYIARNRHGATTFRDSTGKLFVMAAGGFDGSNWDSYEIYDPETEEWTLKGYLNAGRYDFPLVTLSGPSGDIILASHGRNDNIAEIWSLENGQQWIITDSTNYDLHDPAAVKISPTKVMITGGWSWSEQRWSPSCEIWDSETGLWSETDSLETGRGAHTATFLSIIEEVLVNGGHNTEHSPVTLNSTEKYNPLTGLWQEDAEMNYARMNQASVLIIDGQVLTIDGTPWGGGINELYSWNHQPQASQLQGPSQGFTSDTLFFSLSVSDTDNDSVSVRFSWGDGDTTNWSAYQPSGAEFVFSYVFSDSGEYLIQAQARDIWQPQGIHNSLGEWSEPLVVSISDTTVGIDPESLPVPLTLALSQNYPNPFNQSTVISYQLPMNGSVELIIYNLMGQKVKTLTTGFQRAGYYSLIWDSRNEYSQEIPSGIYVYCLTAPDRVISRKMILVK